MIYRKIEKIDFMKDLLRKLYRILLKRAIFKIHFFINKLGNKKQCYVCQTSFHHFLKFRRGSGNVYPFLTATDTIGSDVNNFSCMYCQSTDRERHLYMYFDKLNLWDKISKSRILHFAPEKNLKNKIKELNPAKYILADLNPENDNINKIDATKIPYENDSVDFVFFNHILEHIPDYKTALNELFRVLTPGGTLIIQTPFSKLLSNNFEENNICSDELRNFFYGQEDHVRLFAEKQLFNDIQETGFNLQIKKNDDFFNEKISKYYGINRKEDLIMAIKPN